MASNQTPNIGLNQWDASDRVLRNDFNADNEKLDAALAARPPIVIGYYAGNNESRREFDLGGKPKAVLLVTTNGIMGGSNFCYGGLALHNRSLVGKNSGGGTVTLLAVTENGFRVANGDASCSTNLSATGYLYIALM